MAVDAKISDLNEVTSPTSSDPLAIVNAAETKKVTLANLLGANVAQGYFTSLRTSGNAGIGTNIASYAGLFVVPTGLSGTAQYGGLFQPVATSGATSTAVGIQISTGTADASFTVTTAAGLRIADASKGAASTITNLYGLLIADQLQGGTNYAIKSGAGLVEFGDDVYCSDAAGPSLLNEAASLSNPTIVPNRADPDSGIGQNAADQLTLITGGAHRLNMSSTLATFYTHMSVEAANGPQLMNEAASNTNPTVIPSRGDQDTGVGANGADALHLIAGGTSYLDVTSASPNVTFNCSPSVSNAAGPQLMNEAASSTNPTLIPNRADPDTGVGWNAADRLELIAGGASMFHLDSVGRVTIGHTGVSTSSGLVLQWEDSLSGTSQIGVNLYPRFSSAATSNMTGLQTQVRGEDASYTTTTMRGIYVGPNVKGASQTVTTNYGLYVGEQSVGGATNWAIYVQGSSSFFGGSVQFDSNAFVTNAAGPTLLNEAATSTNPTLIPNRADTDTGLGWQAADVLSLIAGSVEGLRLTESGSSVSSSFSGSLEWGGGATITSSDDVMTRDVVCYVVEGATDVETGDAACYFTVGDTLNGMDLIDCHARVITAGTTGTTDIQFARYRSSWVDMLTTKLTIDSGETGSEDADTAFSINTSNDDVAEHDLIRIDIDAVSTTAPKGLIVRLTFQKP